MDQDMLPAYHAKGAAGGYAKDVLALNRVLEMLKVLLMVLLQPPFLLYLFLQKLKLLRLMLAISKGDIWTWSNSS
jgi:hypothetical protein